MSLLPLIATQLLACTRTRAPPLVQEGENNEKLVFHPRNTQSMSSYRFVHNKIFYALDLLASLLLLCLTLFEAPAVQGLQVDKSVSARPVVPFDDGTCSLFQVHVSIELLCLTVISIECCMKLRWMGFRSFITHPRTVIKVSCTFERCRRF